jgi:hypothetical protein
MTEERENYLTGLIAIMMSGAFFPTQCVISDEPQRGELRYIDNETYPIVSHEEIETEID